jgi:hypothetical protein
VAILPLGAKASLVRRVFPVRLLRKVENDSQIQARLLSELSSLNAVLVKATAKNRFQRFLDKLFGAVKPPYPK